MDYESENTNDDTEENDNEDIRKSTFGKDKSDNDSMLVHGTSTAVTYSTTTNVVVMLLSFYYFYYCWTVYMIKQVAYICMISLYTREKT